MPPQEIAEISGSAKERSFAESLRMESEGVPRQPTQMTETMPHHRRISPDTARSPFRTTPEEG